MIASVWAPGALEIVGVVIIRSLSLIYTHSRSNPGIFFLFWTFEFLSICYLCKKSHLVQNKLITEILHWLCQIDNRISKCDTWILTRHPDEWQMLNRKRLLEYWEPPCWL